MVSHSLALKSTVLISGQASAEMSGKGVAKPTVEDKLVGPIAVKKFLQRV